MNHHSRNEHTQTNNHINSCTFTHTHSSKHGGTGGYWAAMCWLPSHADTMLARSHWSRRHSRSRSSWPDAGWMLASARDAEQERGEEEEEEEKEEREERKGEKEDPSPRRRGEEEAKAAESAKGAAPNPYRSKWVRKSARAVGSRIQPASAGACVAHSVGAGWRAGLCTGPRACSGAAPRKPRMGCSGASLQPPRRCRG